MAITIEQLKALKPNDVIYQVTEGYCVDDIYCVGDILIKSLPNRVEKVFFSSSSYQIIRVSATTADKNYFLTEKEALETAIALAKHNLKKCYQFDKGWLAHLKDKLKALERREQGK